MVRQAIRQATCENCDDEEAEFTVTDKDFLDDDVSTIQYDVRCSCGEEGVITVDENGTNAGDGINHEDASWNQPDSDESEDGE